jgi:hypothetical protein
MELALNLAWALIAAASYAQLFRYLARGAARNARDPSRAECIIALTCVLAILFPVISLTDDLHEMQATCEEASTSGLVIKKCVAGHLSTPERTLHQVLFTVTSVAANFRWTIVGGVAARQSTRNSTGPDLCAIGRAPPFLYHSASELIGS